MLQGQLLSDHSAHRDSKDGRAFYSRGVEDRSRIVGHVSNRKRSRTKVGAAHAPVVEYDGSITMGEHGPHPMPHFRSVSKAHDEKHRIARAMLLPIYL